jgi:Mg2+ and Co2+ transporter CorA
MKRVRYISRFSEDLSREDIEELVRRAAQKNASLDITGILMSSGQVFFQVLEGPVAHVDQIYQSILADDRHRDVLLLDSEEGVTKRFFPDWAMRRFDLDDTAVERLGPVRKKLVAIVETRRDLAKLTRDLERAVWRELAGRPSSADKERG